jgi:hypothetical protein
VPEKTNEITIIPELLDHLAETKQLEERWRPSTPWAVRRPSSTRSLNTRRTTSSLEGNQPTLDADVTDYFSSAPTEELVIKDAEIENGLGRISAGSISSCAHDPA